VGIEYGIEWASSTAWWMVAGLPYRGGVAKHIGLARFARSQGGHKVRRGEEGQQGSIEERAKHALQAMLAARSLRSLARKDRKEALRSVLRTRIKMMLKARGARWMGLLGARPSTA